ncbi:MAG: hypothetical protein JXQ93_11235 [Flavobacteriaceae bacterium]
MVRKIFLYIFMLSTSFVFAQKTSGVTAKVDTTNIRIGEQFQFKIEVNDTSNVILPKLENLKGLEIVEEDNIDTIKNSLIKRYILTGFDSGAFYIPQQQIFIRNQAFLTDSILINVATVPIDTLKQKMFPIKSIQEEPYVFDDFKPYLIWVILGLVLIGVLLYFIFRKKKEEDQKEVIPLIPAFDEALEKLKELDNKLLWQNNKIKQYYSELTEIVRNYLGRDIEIPTLELTSNEIIELIETQNASKGYDISKETISSVSAFFKNADLVKFAKSKPMSFEIENDRKSAENLINNIQLKIKEYRISMQEEEEIDTDSFHSGTSSEKTVDVIAPKKEPKKKFDKKKIIITIITVTAVTLSVNLGSRLVKYIGGLTATTEKLYNTDWGIKSYGTPKISLELPFGLSKKEVANISEEVKNYIQSVDGYQYNNASNYLDVSIAPTVYKSGITANLDGAVNGIIQALKKEKDVSDFNHTISDYKENGKSIIGSFRENDILKEYEAIVVVHENKICIISLIYKFGDEYGKKIIDRIKNSIKIDFEDELE